MKRERDRGNEGPVNLFAHKSQKLSVETFLFKNSVAHAAEMQKNINVNGCIHNVFSL